MKCDELKDYDYDPDFPFQSRGRFYVADEVDAAIDELKTENESLLQQNRELCLALQVMYSKEEYDKQNAEHHKERHEYIKMIAELKQKLEDAKATAYAESVDAGMRERRLRRALYKALANWAHFAVAFFSSFKTKDKWHKMEHKCLKKAEEYK